MAKGVAYLLPLLCLCSAAFAQPKATVHVRALPLSAFTKLPIDTSLIKVVGSLDTLLPNPTRFRRQLTRVLRHMDTIPASRFRHDFVRTAFLLTQADGRQINAFVAKGYYFLCEHRVYLLGNPLLRVLRRDLPQHDFYLPLLSRRLRRIVRERELRGSTVQ